MFGFWLHLKLAFFFIPFKKAEEKGGLDFDVFPGQMQGSQYWHLSNIFTGTTVALAFLILDFVHSELEWEPKDGIKNLGGL